MPGTPSLARRPSPNCRRSSGFADRKSAVTRIWTAEQHLGETLGEEMKIAGQDMLRAQQKMMSVTTAQFSSRARSAPEAVPDPSR